MTPLSATQIIYAGLSSGRRQEGPGEIDPHRFCRICGGPLLLPPKPLQERSGSWTDENLCRRKDSAYLCRACGWFTEGKNRARLWGARPVFYASPRESRTMTVPELYHFLREEFPAPAVFLVRGHDPNLLRKHIQWRVLDAVTYDRKKTRVLFCGLQLWRHGGQTTGTAAFDADEFVLLVDLLSRQARPYIQLLLARQRDKKKKPAAWFTQNLVMENFLKALHPDLTMDLYLAAYVASHVLTEELLSGRGG